MGLKVAYIILKTFCLVKGCKFMSVSGFELNDGGAVKANKSLSFVMEKEGVILKKTEPSPFVLPNDLYSLNLNNETLPEYVIAAV